MSENHQDIIERSLEVYMHFGIKSVTMTDMARKLGISKKTLYKYVDDKDDLVSQALRLQGVKERTDIEAICALNYNAIEESFAISQYVSNLVKNVNPSVHYDLEKYHKKACDESSMERNASIFHCLSQNLTKGIDEGIYRGSINIEVIIKLYLSKVHSIYDGKLFPSDRFTFVQVNEEFFEYHIRGIATQKGIEFFEQLIKNRNQ